MYLNDLATIPGSLAGIPAMSVPSGIASDTGLPVGLQIMGPALGEERIYRVAAAFEIRLCGTAFRARAGCCAGIEDGGLMTVTSKEALRAPDGLMDFDEAIERYDPVLGLEVHVELGTATKMFCGCPTEFGAPPNTQVCPVCLALPGAMPTINRTAVEYAIRIGLALNCTIASWCRFARKNYFYPDMPKNFQTSQYDEPIALPTVIWTSRWTARPYRIEIERAHLEEDTGKTLHVGGCHRPDPRRRPLADRLQPGRRPAGRDRHPAGPRTGPRRRRWPGPTSPSCATS